MSVFLEVPENEWVAENTLAFAIRDRHPVSHGHTLVITRREVPDWFAATPEERLALIALVDEVKQQLDRSTPPPHGYNVGFNAGEVAGQTVMHLHIHVIPRFRGDMDDPRGGVRHVIPSKGNYLRQTSSLATGGDDPFSRHVLPLFDRAERIAIVAAFVQSSGLERIEIATEAALRRGSHVRIVTGDYLNITQADALTTLLDWERASDDDDSGHRGRFEARIIEVVPPAITAFHPKSWRFESASFGVAFVGSSNLSRSALERGIEWNLRVERDRDCAAYDRIRDAFEDLWARGRVLDADWIAAYAKRARRVQLPLPAGEEDPDELPPPPEPHEVQRDALAALRATRGNGRTRGIVVLATGLGKTWLAAFDFKQLAVELNRLPRVLFVAHRAELLTQATKTFRRQLAAMGAHEASVGWYFGNTSELSKDLVFASVAKLARADNLPRLQQEQFDYVVIDEVHHAAADSYRKILDRVDPRFLLGLTATPDRADTADILGLFDDNIVFRADIARGIELKRLSPFQYFGVKDDIDYDNIPWRNRHFDPATLASAVQSEARMNTLWRAWNTHTGVRTLIFCCSIAHANFVRDWLRRAGVRIAAVYADDGSDDREGSLAMLEAGELDAVCAVDVFNEGVDVPSIDRVVMLRPTESSVVFLQQLGRGLRAFEGKAAVNVIDFVGNHRVFLERLRALLDISGGDDRPQLRELLSTDKLFELPAGCSIDLELEAKRLLQNLFKVGGADEVERTYRELVIERGANEERSRRPTAGELQRIGYPPKHVRDRHGSWFDFVRGEDGLDPEETAVVDQAGAFLRELEVTEMTKCFKMVTLEALIERDALLSGLDLDELARRAHAILRRSPELLADVPEEHQAEPLDDLSLARWSSYWKKNPIAAWTARKAERAWFRVESTRFRLDLTLAEHLHAPLQKLARELVDYRLSQYRDRRREADPTSDSFVCKVIRNETDPIIKLPSRGLVDLPLGEKDVRLPDGSVWQFRFAKIACNVARPAGTPSNRLPELLTQWFGADVGRPGTAFQVRFRASPNGLWIEPVQVASIDLEPRRRIVAYPDLRAAAGHAIESFEPPDENLVSLPFDDASSELFAIRVAGTSMDGGKQPLRDGDWAVMRVARSMPQSSVENRVVLVQIDNDSGAQYVIKRLQRIGARWQLTSDNPSGPTFAADEGMTPIARLERGIHPEDLGPPINTVLAEDELAERFGIDSLQPRTDRHEGHLFVFIDAKGLLSEPDRLQLASPRPRPAETAFVLARRTEHVWQYLGVARQGEEVGVWSLPSVEYSIWKQWGEGRETSRRLPEAALARAQLTVDALLSLLESDRWITQRDGRKAHVLGVAARGGIRIDGGDGGFKERTVSVTDLAWAIVAADDVDEFKGILDEQRVNKLRYLDGTPEGSTRWIDTGWAIAAWTAAKDRIHDPVAIDTRLRRMVAGGKAVDASFRVERVGAMRTIVFESRGGTKGTAGERNVDYAEGLRLVLDRLRDAGLSITDIVVESRDTENVATTERRVLLKDQTYPITIKDAELLRKKISAGQAEVGRKTGAKGGGNQNKRLRIFVSGESLTGVEELGRHLEGV